MSDENKSEVKSEGPKIWSSILQQVRQTDTKKLPSDRSILVLGDNETGKTSLIAKLAKIQNPKKGSGLEYNFIEIRDDYRDDTTKLNAWILNGDDKHVNLMNFALTDRNFESSCCILVASMSQPWNIMRSLETWADILEKHIQNLRLRTSRFKQCQQNLNLKFVNYVAPSDEAECKLIAGATNLDQTLDSEFQDARSDEDEQDHQEEKQFASSQSNHQAGRNILTKNLGIEVVVVITKTDSIAALEKDYDYTEEKFDFIQQAIRKFCLQYGASLIYVSAKVNKNIDLLHKYLAHRIYDLPFKTTASVVDKDAIFVPAGWDNGNKISILYDNIRIVDPDERYENFITQRVNPGPSQRDAEIDIESDQEFLSRMQRDLGSQEHSLPSAPSPVQPRQTLTTRPANSASEIQAPNEGVLQNFFNSLISKGPTRPIPPS